MADNNIRTTPAPPIVVQAATSAVDHHASVGGLR